jgi:hypothetical protein
MPEQLHFFYFNNFSKKMGWLGCESDLRSFSHPNLSPNY